MRPYFLALFYILERASSSCTFEVFLPSKLKFLPETAKQFLCLPKVAGRSAVSLKGSEPNVKIWSRGYGETRVRVSSFAPLGSLRIDILREKRLSVLTLTILVYVTKCIWLTLLNYPPPPPPPPNQSRLIICALFLSR